MSRDRAEPSVREVERDHTRLPVPAALIVASGIVCGILSAASDCSGTELPPLRAEEAPSFTADVAITLDTSGTPGLTVSVSLPYTELQWVRLAGAYGAGIEVTVVFEPPRHDRSYGDSWERKLVVSQFEQTNSTTSTIVERRSFGLPPGRYEMRVRVQDLNSGRESSGHERIQVPDYSRVPLAIADLELGRLGAGGAFEALTTRRYGRDSDRLAVRILVVDRRPGTWPRSYLFGYRLLDESSEELLSGHRTLSLTQLGGSVVLRPDSAQLFVGTYVLEVTMEEGRARWRLERTFEVEESGPPRGREFRRMLEPLAYIATPEEIDQLNHVPEDGQAAAWEAFWKRRDPTPNTARNEALIEFLRRVRYTNEHFQHFGPGWRSDMGRIYIKFGPPDQVESRRGTSTSRQIEIWYYNQPYRQFVFEDRDGFGRFVLVSPGAE